MDIKRIAIVTEKLHIGGIETALINMLNNIDYTKYYVDLYVLVSGGELEYKVPKDVNVIYLCASSNINRLKQSILNFQIKRSLALLRLLIAFYCNETRYKKNNFLLNTLDSIPEYYDMAISYHNPISFCTLFVIEKINSKYKIMWVHSDINEYLNIVDDFKEYYHKFDKIFCVSNGSMLSFTSRYLELKNKCEVFYNSLFKKDIKSHVNQASSRIFPDKEGIKILTVCRLAKEKGVDLIPDIAKKLKDSNIKFQWLIIGKGNLDDILRQKISTNDLTSELILYGEVLNPYNAMNECDIYVQPSRFEAYCITVAEAKCLEKPIVATDIIGINEQIVTYENGILCELNKEDFSEKIIELVNNENLRLKICNNLMNELLDTRSEIKKIYNIIS